MEDWNNELILGVLQYLNARDAGRFSLQSRRCAYLVHTFRCSLRGCLELSTAQSLSAVSVSETATTAQQLSAEQVCQDAISRLRSPPSLILSFSSTRGGGVNDEQPLLQRPLLHCCTPSDLLGETVLLGVVADSIQTVSPTTSFSNSNIECQSHHAVMMMAGLNSLPYVDAVIQPLFLPMEGGWDDDTLRAYRDRTLHFYRDWKVFILYVCGDDGNRESHVNQWARLLQEVYPDATIVGGICDHAFVSVPMDRSKLTMEQLNEQSMDSLWHLRTCLGDYGPSEGLDKAQLVRAVYNAAQSRDHILQTSRNDGNGNARYGLYGVAMAGSVPHVRSVVSSGAESLTSRFLRNQLGHWNGIPPQPHSTSYFVHDALVFQASDYLFDENYDPIPIHCLRSIIDRSTGRVHTARDLLRAFGEEDFYVGFRQTGVDGFVPRELDDVSAERDDFVVLADSSDDAQSGILGRNVDFFRTSGDAILTDMERCLDQLKASASDEDVLGGLLIACRDRGPEPGDLVDETMADASRLARAFPNVPFLGYYAHSAIGSWVLPGRQSVFGKERVYQQTSTAVVLLFTMPKGDHHLDPFTPSWLLRNDNAENVKKFSANRLGRGESAKRSRALGYLPSRGEML